MNKVILIGNLTKDPEVSQTNDGKMYARMTIAVSRDYTNQDGSRDTDFFDFTVWGKEPRFAINTSKKARRLLLSEAYRTTTTPITTARSYTQEVKCKEIEFLSSKKSDDTPGRKNETGTYSDKRRRTSSVLRRTYGRKKNVRQGDYR